MSDSRTATVVDYLQQWMFDPNNPAHPLLPKTKFGEHPDRNYNLKGLTKKKFLQHEKQIGMNIGWTKNASAATAEKAARWFLARKGASDRPIRYGETIAIGNGRDPSFIQYERRTIGINLDYSKRPVFEWKILGGPVGDPVSSRDRVAIFNEKAGDCLIYFDRTKGGDIGWPSSKTWGDQAVDAVTQAVKDHWKEGVMFLLAA